MKDKPQNAPPREDEYDLSLQPDPFAGQNIGPEASGSERRETAGDRKELHSELKRFGADELRQIPIVPEGSRLQQGATYMDLRDLTQGEFTATAEQSAKSGSVLVAKSEVPYTFWNRLRGINDPERL